MEPRGASNGGEVAPRVGARRTLLVWVGVACALIAAAWIIWIVGARYLGGESSASGTRRGGEGAASLLDPCRRAMACCKLVTQGSGKESTTATCNSLDKLPPSACEQALAAYKRSASVSGASCE